MKLILCDIDGVLIDSSARDHLAPSGDAAKHNVNWIAHQKFSRDDKWIYSGLSKLLAEIADDSVVAFVTSRLGLPGNLSMISKMAMSVGLSAIILHREFSDSRPAATIKYFLVTELLLDSNPHEIVIIDDLIENVTAMSEACEEALGSHVPIRRIHVTNLTEWNEI